MGLRHVR